ncbi:MAG: hypothetical protein FJY82_15185 [Candidatus Aminicenantes bacterium]|nr:hypothetical protein [Candidatus Aminicenantes bacterium]
MRYIERNPVRAGIVDCAENYRWSSASSHVLGSPDAKLKLLDWNESFGIEDWRAYLRQEEDDDFADLMKEHERTGRPLGSEEFIEHLENQTGRVLTIQSPGRKRKECIAK